MTQSKSQISLLIFLPVAAYAVFFLASKSAPAQSPLFFKGVNVFDGSKQTGPTNVLIADGKIKAIGNDLSAAADVQVIEGAGKTLLPGLIDCHTHVWSDKHLQQAAIFGVTTELDMMSSPFMTSQFRRQQSNGKANHRADFFSAGAAVTVKKGHGTQFGFQVPTLEKPEDAKKFVQDRLREGSDFIKIIHEDGSAYGGSRPTLSDEMFAAAVAAAHHHDKLAVAHISTAKGAQLAFESGIDGLVHLFADQEISDEMVQLATSKNVFVVPTLSVVSNVSGKNFSNKILKDPHLIVQLNDENRAGLKKTFRTFPRQQNNWSFLKLNVAKLHAAGVPILAGTDSPNPGTTHGASMHQELRLLVDSGLSPLEALASATSVAAKCFQLNDRGRIEVDLRADLVLVNGDPTHDITDLAKIVGVWKSGHPIDRKTRADQVAAEAKR